MTPEQKAEIDALSHYDLLSAILCAKPGDARFRGAYGEYGMARYAP